MLTELSVDNVCLVSIIDYHCRIYHTDTLTASYKSVY